MPFFSILIPSYNRPEFLPLAVSSVLASDCTDFELIISDDASPRQSEIRQAILPYTTDTRVRFIEQKTNLGEARSREYLMQAASGSYLLILGDDDLLAPNALSRIQAEISRDSSYALYLFGYSIIDDTGRVFETRRALDKLVLSLDNSTLIKDLFCSDLHPFWLYHPATFCFSATLRGKIVPNHNVGIGDDLMYLYEVILSGRRAVVIPEALFSYRKFGISSTYAQGNQSNRPLANVLTRRHILYDLLDKKNLPTWLRDFVASSRFRQRFLYAPAATDELVTADNFSSMDLLAEHLEEFRVYWRYRHFSWFRGYLLLCRIVTFVRYFGMSAISEIFRITKQRLCYRHVASN